MSKRKSSVNGEAAQPAKSHQVKLVFVKPQHLQLFDLIEQRAKDDERSLDNYLLRLLSKYFEDQLQPQYTSSVRAPQPALID